MPPWSGPSMVNRRAALLLTLMLGVSTVAAAAELEINTATQAQLESLPGIGPALAERILAARMAGVFADWPDLRHRVKGIGTVTARKLSAAGLRVNGQAFDMPAPAQND